MNGELWHTFRLWSVSHTKLLYGFRTPGIYWTVMVFIYLLDIPRFCSILLYETKSAFGIFYLCSTEDYEHMDLEQHEDE